MAKPKEIDQANGTAHSEVKIQLVGIEILPYPDGAAISLVSGEGKDEDRMSARLGPKQLREIASRMLILADAAETNMRTILLVTPLKAWIPGQCLQIRLQADNSFHYQFTMQSPIAVPEMPKLIIPGK